MNTGIVLIMFKKTITEYLSFFQKLKTYVTDSFQRLILLKGNSIRTIAP